MDKKRLMAGSVDWDSEVRFVRSLASGVPGNQSVRSSVDQPPIASMGSIPDTETVISGRAAIGQFLPPLANSSGIGTLQHRIQEEGLDADRTSINAMQDFLSMLARESAGSAPPYSAKVERNPQPGEFDEDDRNIHGLGLIWFQSNYLSCGAHFEINEEGKKKNPDKKITSVKCTLRYSWGGGQGSGDINVPVTMETLGGQPVTLPADEVYCNASWPVQPDWKGCTFTWDVTDSNPEPKNKGQFVTSTPNVW